LSPIRPTYQLPVAQPRPVRPETRAAQRAFFEAAINQPTPTRGAAASASAAAEPIQAAAAAGRATREPLDGQPQRYLRPGSLVDIKV
jgi:hypothetical protein